MMMTRAKSHHQNRQKERPSSEKKKKEAKQLFQEEDEEDEESDNHGFTSFGFCTVNNGNNIQLQNMLLLDSCSTVDLFCNKNLVTKIWKTKNSMTVKGNGGDQKPTRRHKSKTTEKCGLMKEQSRTSCRSRISRKSSELPMTATETGLLPSTSQTE